MSIRRQAYEWRNLVPGSTAVVSNSGHPVLNYNVATGNVDGRAIEIPALVPFDIMVGGVGNNLEEPALLRANQLIVVDHMGSYPASAGLNIRIGTTRYFQNPDGVPDIGMPSSAMPFQPITIPTGESKLGFFEEIVPPVYILPGQTWGIEFTTFESLNRTSPTPTSDTDIARAYVRYLLIDGPDQLIATRLLEQNIPISAENIQWYKQNLIRNRLRADLGIEDALEERLAGKERRLI